MKESQLKEQKSSAVALIPLLAFVVIYLGAGIVLQIRGVEMAFYQFPAASCALFAAVIAFIVFRENGIDTNFKVFSRGAGSEDMMCMLMIFLLAGAFSTVAGAMGGVDAAVNLGLTVIPVHFITAGVFVIASFIGVATGTSMGTLSALVPIAVGMADKASLSLPMVMAACLTGAMFGDNLSMISDTTISATRTQNVELKDKFRTNFNIALPAAIITIVLLLIFGRPDTAAVIEIESLDIIRVLPYVLVLVLAIIGINVYLVLTLGLVSAGVIGIAYGDLTVLSFASSIWEGYQGMFEVFVLAMFFGGIAEMSRENGGIQWLVDKMSHFIKGKTSASIGISALVAATDLATANNTVAIIVTGPIAKDISRRFKVDPRRAASLLDIFACIAQGFIPYGAQVLLIVSLTGGTLNPFSMLSYNWYLMLLGLFAILAIIVPTYSRICCKGEWDFENNRVLEPESEKN